MEDIPYCCRSTATVREYIRFMSDWNMYGIQGASLRGRLTPPATLAQEGKKVHQIMRSEQRPTIEFSVFKDRNRKPAT